MVRRPLARQRGRPLAARRRRGGRQVAGRPARAAARPRRARARRSRSGRRSSSASGCCRARSFVGVTGTNGKTTTAELLGAIFARGGPRRRRRRQRRHAAHLRPCGRLGRVRAVVLPARGRARARLRRCGPAQPRARPPRPARLVRGLPRREAPHLRARAGKGRARAGSGSTGIEFAADDVLPAEPLLRGRAQP